MEPLKEEHMKPIRQSIEVARRPEDVFSYATDFARFPEWQVVRSRQAPSVILPPDLVRGLPSPGKLAQDGSRGPR
jgi:hypothetical protein